MRLSSQRRAPLGPVKVVGVLLVLVALVLAGWWALHVEPAPAIIVETDREAIGPSTAAMARFTALRGSLETIRLELVQGDRREVLAERTPEGAGPFSLLRRATREELVLATEVGARHQEWLREGTATLRAVAKRHAGPLRSPAESTTARDLPVQLRPPRLGILSNQHYVRQGGAGAVVIRVGDTATRSGVVAGELESLSYPLPGGTPGERFVLYAIPWQLGDGRGIRAFAEDAAGNRAEAPFVDIFKSSPPTHDVIAVDDAFLDRVVPAIASQTPGFSAQGSLLDQYLEINGRYRRESLAAIREMARDSVPEFLWSGPFMQMPNTQRRASFADSRTYTYQGRTIDEQTHLGLDLASTERAPVPAANAGRVMLAGWMAIYGNTVIIDHGYGLMSLYGHLSSIDAEEGQRVGRGEVIGRSGTSGLAGGDHLHLEIFVQGQSVNPVEWLDGNSRRAMKQKIVVGMHWSLDNLPNVRLESSHCS
jgi:murein DD-endopeptidase MepM/ murein hydrolase activator NlpD